VNQQELHESAICRFIRGVPTALYDIGVGTKTEWRTLARKYPAMHVFGCEPHPAQYEKLLKDKFPGPLAKVAIGENEGIATLHVPTHDLKCCSLLPVPYANATEQVKVWTLDRFDVNMGQPDRILLWIDIEGSELSAFRSGRRLLASGRVRWINLEERRDGHRPAAGWCDPKELHALLTSHHYIRVADYNRHPTHQDAIYVHKDEPPCSAPSR
jgi:FkbM family methyltransferase